MLTPIELYVQRGRLRERIARERETLRAGARPVKKTLDTADRIGVGLRVGAAYLRQHPWMIGAPLAAALALKGRGICRLAKRGFALWRTWRTLRRVFRAGLGYFS